jgi:hypothetical protein
MKKFKWTTVRPWVTFTTDGDIDTCNTEVAAWHGLTMALENPSVYFADQKMVDGHMEVKVYYIDEITKELKFQYGWAGLGMNETLSAYAIFHEINLRWAKELEIKQLSFEERLSKLEQYNKKSYSLGLDIKLLIGLVFFLAILGLVLAIKY